MHTYVVDGFHVRNSHSFTDTRYQLANLTHYESTWRPIFKNFRSFPHRVCKVSMAVIVIAFQYRRSHHVTRILRLSCA